MNKYKYYLFDLDGTISESALGIRESLENAIKSMGKPLPNLDDYTLYIGPPLLDTFRNICKAKITFHVTMTVIDLFEIIRVKHHQHSFVVFYLPGLFQIAVLIQKSCKCIQLIPHFIAIDKI